LVRNGLTARILNAPPDTYPANPLLSSYPFQLGNQEATWVVADYIATSGSNELSVSKGQQVEIVEPPTAGEPDFCLVRLNPQHDDAAVQEGLVPVSVLKPPPGSHKHGSGTAANAASAAGSQKSDMQDQSKCIDFIYIYGPV